MGILVLTVVGDDRPGLVSALSGVVAGHGGSWEHSQMARLAGTFAGIVSVTVADDRVDALLADLDSLAGGGLEVRVRTAVHTAPPVGVHWTLSLVGDDRPGIVHQVTDALAGLGVSIEELTTATRDAPMSGGVLFEAQASLIAPSDVTVDAARAALEHIADELMVELTVT
jgi:glycine cleavage system regulatory protein